MFVSIRKYRNAPKEADIFELVETGLVPLLKEIPGFQAYYLVNCGHDTLTAISVFTSPEAALASNQKAAEWVKANIGEDLPSEATAGEVLINALA